MIGGSRGDRRSTMSRMESASRHSEAATRGNNFFIALRANVRFD
jgi:hypothetical protein